ncbi:hypothetical protein PF002_g19116 [Phytophthora fragariae]|uniref:Uncharacterized protein n=1 Tax=Phytophthora fragariae TaxID=53985 RepID=A0A6A3RDH3_9STRA|nr:hypothetical protein PF003_g7004 [Phytophthora fragariae]KAE8930935.1 hypothetical protein PF009_g18990 [Phytophthora fragariae]KAE9094379.1 hypothetical protein PF007_g17783 [Phytophthora fragariae]KAE9209428.1 hypothetical protein PF002_g19116 [Phytophthora fragariae]KAE9315830.1 hypothetical protein PF001_g7600 [Phytophthora fragariae]
MFHPFDATPQSPPLSPASVAPLTTPPPSPPSPPSIPPPAVSVVKLLAGALISDGAPLSAGAPLQVGALISADALISVGAFLLADMLGTLLSPLPRFNPRRSRASLLVLPRHFDR